jgi:hypothetical protein
VGLTEVMKIEKINLNQVISFVILLVAGFLALSIYKGGNEKIAQIHQIQNEQEEKNKILFHLGDLKNRISLYKKTFKPKDRREIINRITELATASGVKIISLKPQDRSPRSKIKSEVYDENFFNLSIQVKSYHQLGRFISRLENSPAMFFVVESAHIVRTSELIARPEKLRVELVVSELFFTL